jgi:hypothetical protein
MARLRCTFALASTLALLAVNTAAAAYEAPDPGGDEGAAVPVPPPTKLFGFNDSSYMVPERQVSAGELADLFVGAGANAGRINLDWRYLERDRDVWDEAGWAMYEAMYDQLVIRGLTPLMVIGAAPPWARDPGAAQTCSSHQDCEYPPARAMVGEWAEFAAEVTRRFPQAAIAVWNEPNLYQNWAFPSPERWAELVVHAYDAVKTIHPGVPVIAGGLAINQSSPTSLTLGASIPLREFLRRAYAARPSLAGHLDAIGLNANNRSLDYGAGSLFAKGLHDIRTVRREAGDAGRPIWITETWLSTSGAESYSEAQQASGLLRQYRRAMTMPDVHAFFVHTMLDVTEAPAGSWDRGVGLTWISNTTGQIVPKLSYCTFAGRVEATVPALGCPRIDEGTPPVGDPGGGIDPGAGGGGPGGLVDPCLRAKKLKRKLHKLGRRVRRASAEGRQVRMHHLQRRRIRVARRFRASWRECRVHLGLP